MFKRKQKRISYLQRLQRPEPVQLNPRDWSTALFQGCLKLLSAVCILIVAILGLILFDRGDVITAVVVLLLASVFVFGFLINERNQHGE